MNYASKIEQFGKRVAVIDAKLAALAAQRRDYSLEVADNNSAAKKAVALIDQQADALARERTTLRDATEQAERLLREQEAEAAKQDRKRRETEARKLADSVLEASAEIDTAMIALRGLFERRSNLLRELADTRIVGSNYLLRQHGKFVGTCAARKAGLERFVSVEHVPISNVASLVESSKALRGPLTAAVEPEIEGEAA